MANQEHLALLKKSVKQWNEWREQDKETQPDLISADLHEMNLDRVNLQGADLSGANLRGAKFIETDLIVANLTGANLSKANFRRTLFADTNFYKANLCEAQFSFISSIDTITFMEANLTKTRVFLCRFDAHLERADLTNASLTGVDLRHAHLHKASFNNASLFSVDLDNADLSETDFGKARIKEVVFGNVDLRTAIGLETIYHEGPSTIGINTIEQSQGRIPEVFLRGVGLSNTFIEYARSLSTHPIQYHSLFLSYSSQDEILARRLHADLQTQGVRCWFAPHDMRIGDKIRARIDEAIQQQEKLLLLLSEHSIKSDWVEDEVDAAIEKEQRQQREVLFPVRLDEFVMQTTQAWAAKLRRSRNIGDFTNWIDPHAYQRAFDRLLRDLKKADR